MRHWNIISMSESNYFSTLSFTYLTLTNFIGHTDVIEEAISSLIFAEKNHLEKICFERVRFHRNKGFFILKNII